MSDDARSPARYAAEIDAARDRLIALAAGCSPEQWQATPLAGDPRPVGVVVDHVAHAYEYMGDPASRRPPRGDRGRARRRRPARTPRILNGNPATQQSLYRHMGTGLQSGDEASFITMVSQGSVVVKIRSRVAAIGFSAAVVAAGLALPAVATAASQACGGTGSVTTVNGSLADGATFKLQCPAHTWNGTLFLYSHGYVVPGTNNPATDVGDPVTGSWLLNHGFALAGSSYATTGWAIQQALPDQINTLNRFASTFAQPSHTIAWGHSLGGIITAGLIQRYPGRFSAALPMCGVLSGGVATWNTAADAAFAFQQLIDPSVAVVNITNPGANLTGAETAAAQAQQTAQGRARLALVAALGDTPGWFTPLSPEPGPKDFTAQEANQFEWLSQVDGPFIFALRAELEARAGGNFSWTTGVNYTTQLAMSAGSTEVAALYKAAGLNLSADLATLQAAPQISVNPSAAQYVEHNITFDGKLSIPVLTMHTTGDGLVVPENEQAYRSVVRHAGDSSLLRQIFVHRAGHCAFTPAETITAARVLLHRLSTGNWTGTATNPGSLNKRAAALGTKFNIFVSNGQVVPTPPAFLKFSPPPYLRPFNLGNPIP